MDCAGLSTAVGEVACEAVATAREGELPGVPVGSIVGVVEFCARAAPPCETCAVGLPTVVDAVGCVRVAPAELGVICRETVAEEGPSAADEDVCGPAFAGTSATVVTVLLRTGCVLREAAICVVPGVTAGASDGLFESFARRALVATGDEVCVFAATVVGRGAPVAGACCAAATAVRCVAVLVGDSSPEVATWVAAAAVVSTLVAEGTLGALLALRVSDGVCVGLGVAVGADWPAVRVIREAT